MSQLTAVTAMAFNRQETHPLLGILLKGLSWQASKDLLCHPSVAGAAVYRFFGSRISMPN
jgi:hypothetical protein